MNLSLEEMKSINNVQLDIFRHFIFVCEQLNLKYYLVHGSLLGAVRYSNFFPYDDDIDVAMPRKDYNILMEEGVKYLPDYLFIQSSYTEEDFPLQFGKLRNTNTTFFQPEMKRFDINQGIYIDIFPLDFYPDNKIRQVWLKFLNGLYNARISREMSFETKQPLWKSCIRNMAVLLVPSLRKAVEKRANLYARERTGKKLITVGGKIAERGIPSEWFSKGVELQFSDLWVICPEKYKEYLTCIYGDYSSYDPTANYMNVDGTVTVSASVVSVKHSFEKKDVFQGKNGDI